ncbi:hypothetical protein C8F01DRAFT_1053631 [Mycena amicta]|nr:hypothetical protein C8F01DRAFT_1053631 [Mycena amicta]
MLANRTFSSPGRALLSVAVVAYLFYLSSRLSGYLLLEPADGEKQYPDPLSHNRKHRPAKQYEHEQEDGSRPMAETVTVTTTLLEVRTVEAPRATVTVETTREVFVKQKQKPLLRGLPTEAFKDNLLPEVQYITSWTGSGFTNDVMTFINLIYLGLLTQRVPILPHFTPTHVGRDTGGAHNAVGIDFGDVFDLPRYFELTGQPLLEWWQVKDRKSETIDPLGCWNVWEPVSPANKGPHWTPSPHRLKLDVSYANAPGWIKRSPDSPDDLHTQFTALMALGFPTMRNKFMTAPSESPLLKQYIKPDEHMLCFDNLYWACDLEGHEMEKDWSAAWRLVGQHLHWTPKLERLADEYLRQAFGLSAGEPIPPFISIHARRGDFATSYACNDAPKEECFAPLSAYDRRVKQMQADLLSRKGVTASHVILTSDEEDEGWWKTTLETYAADGWSRANHVQMDTAKKHGLWYPILIDAAMQSHEMAMGIVGTFSSTVSIMSGKRIVSWNDAEPLQMVKWGRWGPDV